MKKRIQIAVDVDRITKSRLKKLCWHHQATQRELVKKLIAEEFKRELA